MNNKQLTGEDALEEKLIAEKKTVIAKAKAAPKTIWPEDYETYLGDGIYMSSNVEC